MAVLTEAATPEHELTFVFSNVGSLTMPVLHMCSFHELAEPL